VLSPRAEALLFAADRAEHVATVVIPALERGAIVLTDRYIDSSVAYQGAGRELLPGDIARVSRWATDGLLPDLTIVLDVPVAVGLGRVVAPDKFESEPQDFHDRVRERFLEQARRGGSRYLVIDATGAAASITGEIRDRLEPLLPLTAAEHREIEQRRIADEAERARLAEERVREAAAAAAERAKRDEAVAVELAAAAVVRRAADDARRLAGAQARELARAQKDAEKAARLAADDSARQQRAAAAEAARVAAAAEAARRPIAPATGTGAPTARSAPSAAEGLPASPPPAADPPTLPLTLADELFGAGDETVRLPRTTANEPRDDR
jgi:dTMP kinase